MSAPDKDITPATARAVKQMFSGRLFPCTGFTAADIDIEGDIAPALARLQRYGGALRHPFSVAEHSLMMASAAKMEGHGDEVQLALLLHDAHEAYLGDITTPAVSMIAGACEHVCANTVGEDVKTAIRFAKEDLDTKISEAAGFDVAYLETHEDHVRAYDLRALDFERRHFMAPSEGDWGLGDVEPMPEIMERMPESVRILSPELAERIWRENYQRLRGVVLDAEAA